MKFVVFDVVYIPNAKLRKKKTFKLYYVYEEKGLSNAMLLILLTARPFGHLRNSLLFFYFFFAFYLFFVNMSDRAPKKNKLVFKGDKEPK